MLSMAAVSRSGPAAWTPEAIAVAVIASAMHDDLNMACSYRNRWGVSRSAGVHGGAVQRGVMVALGSAVLFGTSTPLAKVLVGPVPPLLLAGLLYAGSGLGLLLVLAGRRLWIARQSS